MTLSFGTRLGPYEIVAPLGAGGMGEVYRARDPRLGREVAVRVLPASFSTDRDRLRRFEQEARAAGILNHPNIIAVYDVGQHDGSPYIVTELLDGETLRSQFAGGPLAPRRAIDYAVQIAHGLAAAHEKSIIHWDPKPENPFVTRDGRAKILDFGLAKLTHATAVARSAVGRVTLVVACVLAPPRDPAGGGPRARELGIPFPGTPRPHNAITDVTGVLVGHATLVVGHGRLVVGRGPVRTGVTAILPKGRKWEPVFAGHYALNGFGDMTGTHWVDEGGLLGGPVMITNTYSVGVVRDAVNSWFLDVLKQDIPWHQPVVGETWDGFLSDIAGQHVKQEHAFQALAAARDGPVAEGNVGGGTGMVVHGFKGGIGTSSRLLNTAGVRFTVGVLVQANHGSREGLTIAGVPVGKEIADDQPTPGAKPASDRDGSIIGVVATDAPLLPHQLARLARRVPLGIARVGGTGANGSGDIFVAFSTANPGAARETGPTALEWLPNGDLSPFFAATVEATEEAILNAMVAAETMTGIDGNKVHRLPHDRLREVLRKYGRLSR